MNAQSANLAPHPVITALLERQERLETLLAKCKERLAAVNGYGLRGTMPPAPCVNNNDLLAQIDQALQQEAHQSG